VQKADLSLLVMCDYPESRDMSLPLNLDFYLKWRQGDTSPGAKQEFSGKIYVGYFENMAASVNTFVFADRTPMETLTICELKVSS
jgi:hypothetical protein